MLPLSITHALRSFTRAELTQLLTERRARTAIDSGLVVPVLPGRFAGAVHAQSFIVRSHAAVSWCGDGAMLSGRAALHAWNAIADEPRVLTVLARPGVVRAAPRWVHISRPARAPHRLILGGVAVAPIADALVRAWIDEPQASLVYGVLSGRHCTPADVRESAAALPRLRGRAALLRVIANAEGGAESWLEVRARDTVLFGPEFAHLLRQHRVTAAGRAYRLDAYDPDTLTAIEIDGMEHHASREARLSDIRRDLALLAEGIATIRLGYDDVVNRPLWCRELVRRALASRPIVTEPYRKRQRAHPTVTDRYR